MNKKMRTGNRVRRAAFMAALCLFVAVATVLAGCGEKKEVDPAQEQQRFDTFLAEVFREEVQADSITLHYTLAHPENYGITNPKVTLGEYSEKSFQENIRKAEGMLAQLADFSQNCLTEEQRLDYDILKYSLETTLAGKDFFLYEEAFSPTTGLQAQLPVLLAEYKFYSAEDVKDYLELLACVPAYYEELLAAEKLRSEAGLFLADRAVDDIISQCRDFILQPEENFLITSFPARLSGLSDINEDERLAFEYENKQAVLKYVIPAYERLIEVFSELKGTGVNERGLAGLPEGKAYYEWLVKNNTGSDWGIDKMKRELDKAIQQSIMRIQLAYNKNPDVLKQVEKPVWPETEPEAILTFLRDAIGEDYPAIKDTTYSVKYVDPSMQEHLSPAFFLIPALDDWGNLSIYINESEKNGSMDDLFTTLAHEGFPGHLYETVHFNETKPEPIRQLLSFGGYSEGWATYAEYDSYHYAGMSPELTDMLLYNQLAVLAVCGRADIGINYDGWDRTAAYQYLKKYGLAEKEEDVDALYWSCIEEPANSLDYIIGYLEFAGLRLKAEKALGENFRAAEYHEALLDVGPAPFSILTEKITDFIKR